MLYTGIVESRSDPLKLGRCQVRIVGLHTEDKSILPTFDLPYAYIMNTALSASMSGIGYSPTGIVEGTTVLIMFIDENKQQPIIIGTLGGIPQSKMSNLSLNDSDGNFIGNDGGYLYSSDGKPVETANGSPIAVGSKESSNSISSSSYTSDITQPPIINNFDVPIPLVPPSWYKYGKGMSEAKVNQSITALIGACDKVGLSSKYAKCALLGIVGGESGFAQVEEGSYYRETSTLQKLFSVFRNDNQLAEQYTKWVGSKSDFFETIYGYKSKKGATLGNNNPGDGGKYYGMGFIQLTGKSNYTQFQKLLSNIGINVDIVNNPKLLIQDVQIGALVAAMYIKVRTKCDQSDPGFFVAARSAVGADAGTGYETKRKFYNYFMGLPEDVLPTDKQKTNQNRQYSKSEVNSAPINKKSAYSEDRRDADSLGFRDPFGKYPLRNYLHEPDTNRLARGTISETSIEFKDATRKTNIPSANDGISWSQPRAPYSAQYPYNHVYESESGHIQEFDDSPNGERISLYHRAGTFIEIDPNGTQVNRIVGDGYTIIDRNGAIYIGGSAYVTVEGSINILVQGNADIEVDGTSTINIKNDANIGIGHDLKVAVGGNVDIKSSGHLNVESQSINIKSLSTIGVQSISSTNIKSDELNINTKNKINMIGDNIDIKSGNKFNLDYNKADIGNGTTDIKDVDDIIPSTLSPPEYDTGSGKDPKFLPSVDRDFSEVEKYPNPDDLSDPEIRHMKDAENATIPPETLNDASNIPSVVDSVNSIQSSGIIRIPDSTILNGINIATGFNAGYTISKHFKLGHVCLGMDGVPQSINNVRGNRFSGSIGSVIELTDKQIVENLVYVAENILEKIYEVEGAPTVLDRTGTWTITSGWRSGLLSSEHGYGCAVDIQPIGASQPGVVFDWAKRLSSYLIYNQFLFEYLSNKSPRNTHKPDMTRWIHISHRHDKNIMQLATMLDDGDGKIGGWFKPGLICLDDKLSGK